MANLPNVTPELPATTTKMVNIISKETSNGTVQVCMEDAQYYYLPFDKSPLDLSDSKIREKFIKSVENRVRRSKLYKAYVAYLKVDCKLDRCSVFGHRCADVLPPAPHPCGTKRPFPDIQRRFPRSAESCRSHYLHT